MNKSHSFTFITRSAPYGSNRPNLCLDTALAASVFEQQVNYIFMEDGVYQLLKNQDAGSINSKTLGNILETLNLYGVENIYICADAMEERNLSADDLVISAKLISNDEFKTILLDSNTVFNL